MRRILSVSASVGLALWLVGCSGGEEPTAQDVAPTEQAQAPAADPAADASAAASPTATASPQATGQPPRNRPRGILPADLINSTNPDQRLRGIQSDRPDPFSLLPSSPSVTVTRDAQAPSSSSSSSSVPLPGGANRPNIGTGERTRPGRPSGTTTAMAPQSIPVLPDIPRLPRPLPNASEPQPALARAVSVSGVVQIGGTVYAILDAPDEPSSRYVQVGQRLSNGEIVVRRINFEGADSSVILEQAGIQVVRRVGDAPILPEPPAAPGAPAAPAAPTA